MVYCEEAFWPNYVRGKIKVDYVFSSLNKLFSSDISFPMRETLLLSVKNQTYNCEKAAY